MSATLIRPEREIMPLVTTPVIPLYRMDVLEEDLLALRQHIAATRWLDRVAELIEELRVELEKGEGAPASVPGLGQTRQPTSPISPREHEVLALVVAGRTNKEIAEALFVSPYTVKSHVASLLTKLDADNRAQLAGIALKRGLVAT